MQRRQSCIGRGKVVKTKVHIVTEHTCEVDVLELPVLQLKNTLKKAVTSRTYKPKAVYKRVMADVRNEELKARVPFKKIESTLRKLARRLR